MSFSIDLGKIKFHFRGDWSQTTTYERDDVVYRNGSSYVCVPKTSINVDPANNIDAQWRKVAQGSDVGATLINAGDMLYYDGTDFQRIAPGQDRQVLVMNNGVPEWGHRGIVQVGNMYNNNETGYSYAAATVHAIPGLDFHMTLLADNSKFLCSVRCQVDDASSAAFGASVGLRYSIGQGTEDWIYVHWPDQHSEYTSTAENHYYDLQESYFYQEMNQPAGTVIRWQGLVESHNNSFRFFGGNDGSPKRAHEIIIQEYAD